MRKGMAQGLARPSYYDRNPTNKTASAGSGSVAPHGLVTRWTYTVAAGKKAEINLLRCFMQRLSAAAPAGSAEALIQYTPNGGSALTVLSALLITNGVSDFIQTFISSLGEMLAGDVLTGNDSDSSTGGTTGAATSAKVFEFDA